MNAIKPADYPELKLSAILLAGGSGVRFQNSLNSLKLKSEAEPFLRVPKAFLSLNHKPIYQLSIELISPFCDQTLLVVPLGFEPSLKSTPSIIGGKTRFESVFRALQFLSQTEKNTQTENHYVLVHDCARALLHREDLKSLLDAVLDNHLNHPSCSGMILASPVSDSIKIRGVNNQKTTYQNINRDELFAAQTPQIFKFKHLWQAYQHCHQNQQEVTDEASAIEQLALNYEVHLAKHENFKINTYVDWLMAEELLKQRK